MTVRHPPPRTAAETGCAAGDLLLGICQCNRGMLIRVHGPVAPCYDADYQCRHRLEDLMDLHNFIRVGRS